MIKLADKANEWLDLDLQGFLDRYGEMDYDARELLEDLTKPDRWRKAKREVFNVSFNLLDEACLTRDWKTADKALEFFQFFDRR